ncbi:hypothetical protein OEZ66_30055, partial [Escherichia coli]|nr:hypothetical protein [Escherichia coli]
AGVCRYFAECSAENFSSNGIHRVNISSCSTCNLKYGDYDQYTFDIEIAVDKKPASSPRSRF